MNFPCSAAFNKFHKWFIIHYNVVLGRNSGSLMYFSTTVTPPVGADKCILCNDVGNVSRCLVEKEIPIPVKQEPAEIKEPVIEVEKTKSRYKKFILPVPPSPVSINVFV